MRVELTGSELGWLLKMAENYYDSKPFRDWVKKYKMEKVDKFLNQLMCRFHPNNFNAGHAKKIWTLTDDKIEKSCPKEWHDSTLLHTTDAVKFCGLCGARIRE